MSGASERAELRGEADKVILKLTLTFPIPLYRNGLAATDAIQSAVFWIQRAIERALQGTEAREEKPAPPEAAEDDAGHEKETEEG